MLLEVGRLGEWFSAHEAFERLVTRVDSHVRSEIEGQAGSRDHQWAYLKHFKNKYFTAIVFKGLIPLQVEGYKTNHFLFQEFSSDWSYKSRSRLEISDWLL